MTEPAREEVLQLVLRNFPQYRLSNVFCPPQFRLRTLGLFGLLAAMEESLCRASDPLVSRTKLGWWIDEVNRLGISRSVNPHFHPVSQVLVSSQAITKSSQDILVRLLQSTAQRIDAPGLKDESQLESLCMSLGRLQFDLEISLNGQDQFLGGLAEITSVNRRIKLNGLAQLVRESFKSSSGSFFWVPLNLCAKFDLERSRISSHHSQLRFFSLLRYLVENTLQPDQRQEGDFKSLAGLELATRQAMRHWLVWSVLQERQLKRFFGSCYESGSHVTFNQNTNMGDVWAVWRALRSHEGSSVQ